jgi:hypothetical protein
MQVGPWYVSSNDWSVIETRRHIQLSLKLHYYWCNDDAEASYGVYQRTDLRRVRAPPQFPSRSMQ